MAMYSGMDMADTVDDIVREKEETITVDELIEHFGQFAYALKAANPDVNRAEIIVEAMRRFYINGFRDGLREMWKYLADDSDEEVPDEAHRLTMEDLGL